MAPITVLPATDADMPRLFAIFSAAFGRHEAVVDALFPEHWTPKGQQNGAQRFMEASHSDPSVTYLKAIDEQTGEIIGLGKWLFYQDRIGSAYSSDGPWWDGYDPKLKKQVEAYLERFFIWRNRAIERSGGNLAVLDVLAIDPPHQRRGAGGALVAWGTTKADELDLDAVVESSVFGRGLYEKHGFVWRESMQTSLSDIEGLEDTPEQTSAWLTRPRKTNSLL